MRNLGFQAWETMPQAWPSSRQRPADAQPHARDGQLVPGQQLHQITATRAAPGAAVESCIRLESTLESWVWLVRALVRSLVRCPEPRTGSSYRSLVPR
jgi:hypothetical protein